MNFIRSIYTSLFYKVIISCSFVLGLTLLIRLVPSLFFDGTDYKKDIFKGIILLLISFLYAIDLFVVNKRYRNNYTSFLFILDFMTLMAPSSIPIILPSLWRSSLHSTS